MEETLVTVGIPLYNTENFIADTINSVLKQTYKNFELIITDDASPDQSLKIAKSFDDTRIKIIADGENKGLSYRLNEQIKLAKGKYFIRMDCDDIMFPNRLETQINYMEKNPNVDLIASSAVIIDDENNIIGYRKPKHPKNFNEALLNNFIIHPSVCAKLSWYKNVQYNSKLNGVEDFDLWLRKWHDSNFVNLDEPTIFYRDPYKFKIKTYLHRMKKYREMIYNFDILNNKFFLKNKIIALIYFKVFIARFFNIIKLDQLIISKRNVKFKDENKYYQILQQLIHEN